MIFQTRKPVINARAEYIETWRHDRWNARAPAYWPLLVFSWHSAWSIWVYVCADSICVPCIPKRSFWGDKLHWNLVCHDLKRFHNLLCTSCAGYLFCSCQAAAQRQRPTIFIRLVYKYLLRSIYIYMYISIDSRSLNTAASRSEAATYLSPALCGTKIKEETRSKVFLPHGNPLENIHWELHYKL